MAERRNRALDRAVLLTLILIGVYLSGRILGPFLVALTWAAIFAILCRRMQTALARKMTPNRAALVATVIIGLAVVTPVVVLIAALAREVPRISGYLQQSSQGTPLSIQQIWDPIRARSPITIPADPTDVLTKAERQALTFLEPRARALVADVFTTLGTLGAMLFALFFFLRDGEAISGQLRDLLPFSDRENERLMSQTRDLVTASFGAGLVVAAAQGAVGGLAFWLLGLGAPAVWGLVTAFCSLLPVVGATLVWAPAGVGLLLAGEIGRGVAMLLIGAFGISMVDNLLRPLLLTGKTSVSGFVIFFGLLGGAAAFGFIGLFIGPIILVITARLLDNIRQPDVLDESSPGDGIAAA